MKFIGRYTKTPHLFSDKEYINGIATSDWHIADKYSPLPNQACTKEGQTIEPNEVQKKIKSELIKSLKKMKPVDVLIIDGDIMEGIQAKTQGIPVLSTDSDTQVEWAYQFYEETFYKYLNPEKVLIATGTPYHVMVGVSGNLDYRFAEKVDKISDTIFGSPNLRFYLGKDKMLWDVRHRVSVARVNRMMPLEQTFRMFYRECMEGGLEVPDVVGRAHNHNVVLAPTNFSMGTVKRYGWHSPCLKASDSYGEMLSYPGSPKLGFLSFTQGDGRLFGEYHALDVDCHEVEEI